MYLPSREEFQDLATRGNLVPVCRQLMGDTLSPVLAFHRLRGSEYAFLLESVTGGEKISRYSFLGVDPMQVFLSRGGKVQMIDLEAGTTREETASAPLERLQALMDEYQPVHLEGLPRFSGGAVGYFAYDVVRQIERLPNPPARGLDLPEICVGIYNTMIVFDHVNKTCKVVAHADCRGKDPDAAYDKARERVDAIVARLARSDALPIHDVPPVPEAEADLQSNFDKNAYKSAVDKCKEYISAGDIFQVVLSQRFSTPCKADPFEIYRNIRVVNPSPYMFYLKCPDLALVGSSPEVMVRVEEGTITLRPIAGTRPRGADEAEDLAMERDLLADPKELAEHAMLVDLGRNDVGRVSRYGSVNLSEKMVIERYSHVMHIVSNVEGELRNGLTALDALKASLPAGTLSGAPKVRAMEIIDELEPDVRGPYGGAVGYLDFSGNLDTCIVIRTILLHDETAYVQAGAGIVADSIPENEWVETRNKAKALIKAIQMTRNP